MDEREPKRASAFIDLIDWLLIVSKEVYSYCPNNYEWLIIKERVRPNGNNKERDIMM
jgi:hypothetical protein